MQGSDFIFALQDKTFNFWKVDSTGMFVKSSQPYFLDFAPAGWDELVIQNIRNKNYWAIDRNVTLPLSYVLDGAGIMKYIFYTLGIEESVYLVIADQHLDYTAGVSYGYWYKKIYRGEVDLSTFLHNGSKVTCTTLEDTLAKFLKANENTVYEFPMNVPEAVFVKMDGINLHEKLNYQDLDQLRVDRTLLNSLADSVSFHTPTIFVNNEGDSVGILSGSQSLGIWNDSWSDKMASSNFLLQNVGTSQISITISGTLEFICKLAYNDPAHIDIPHTIKFRFLTSNQSETDQDVHEIYYSVIIKDQTYKIDYSLPITLAVNEKLFFEGIFAGGSRNGPSAPELGFYLAAIEFTANSKFSIPFLTRQATTYIPAFRPQYLFGQLINKITEGNYIAAISAYFQTHANKVITSGNAIRGLKDATIKISWTNFYKWWDSWDSVGISEKGKEVNFDRKQNLINPLKIIDLPEVGSESIKVSVAKEYLFNEVEIGYPELKNDVGVLNGNEEFNTKFLFSLGTTKSPGKLEKVSPIKASCYEIEKIRVTTLDKNTTDYKADNDLFVLHITDIQDLLFTSIENVTTVDNRISVTPEFVSKLSLGYRLVLSDTPVNGSYQVTFILVNVGGASITLDRNIGSYSGTATISVYGPYNLDRSLNATATGLLEPLTVFNMGLSPKRMFKNNEDYIHSCCYLNDSGVFKFISADKNNNLVSGGLVEKADVNVGSMAPRFFYPIVLDFDIQAPDALQDLLDNDPLSIFRFPFRGDIYTGILNKVSVAPSTRKQQAYQLLSTASNDLTKLISYYGG